LRPNLAYGKREEQGSAAASAAVRRALAPNTSYGTAPNGSLAHRRRPTTRAASAAPEAGALPNLNCIVPSNLRPPEHKTGASLQTAVIGIADSRNTQGMLESAPATSRGKYLLDKAK